MKNTRKSFKEIRKKNSLTQRGLADLVGVTETTIRNIENKRVNPSFELAIELTKKLEVEFEKLWFSDFNSK